MSFFEELGKWIPNEISKLNSFSKYTGQLAPFFKTLSAVDAGATAYGDSEDISKAIQGAYGGYSGRSQDPGQWGSDGGINRDIWNTIGQVGNVINNPSSIGNNSYLGTDQMNVGEDDNDKRVRVLRNELRNQMRDRMRRSFMDKYRNRMGENYGEY